MAALRSSGVRGRRAGRSANSALWRKVIRAAPDRERTQHFLDLLAATPAGAALQKFSPEQARVLAALFSGSQALAAWLVSNPSEIALLEPASLKFSRRKQGMQNEVNPWLGPLLESSRYEEALARLRAFKQGEMFRIAARDLAQLAGVSSIVQEISDVADVCLEGVWRVCERQLSQRYGQPYQQDAAGRWQPAFGCVFGMGKLGGQELNYSSDVDVLFAYSDEGTVFREHPGNKKNAGRPVLANHQFFNRLAEAFIAEVTRMGQEGAMFRIDLRLRPEGDSGPLSRSLAGYENYYAQWGQTWERMMLIKARHVAGNEAVAAEFLEMIQPFRYPRSTNENVLHEVAEMKDRIESEVVKSGELERNVKLGYGGIREVEFVAQSLQLLHAGRQPFLQGAQTLPALAKLVQYELLRARDEQHLAAAYCFLRDVEHRLQMENNRQTHTIPADRVPQQRLARLMGFSSLNGFSAARRKHSENVRRIFDQVLKAEVPEPILHQPFPSHFEGAEAAWKSWLSAHGFKDPEKAFRVLREFVEGPGYVHVSPRTKTLAFQLLPKLFALCPVEPGQQKSARQPASKSINLDQTEPAAQPPLSDPDRVVTRLDSFIVVYGARATLFELWNSNPGIFELLVLLFDRSEFLAELAIRVPDLVDELVTSGRLRQRKTAQETLADLRHGLKDVDQHLWLRRYHQAELMRIGLRDILGLADFEQYLVELSALADACLQYAFEVAARRQKLKRVPLAIIGLGKLGGSEIDYGSDLDLLFVTDAKAKDLNALTPVALAVMDLLSRRTEQGLVFHTDARLRPDGEKGLMVNSLAAYEHYYRHRAQLWELQSLSRARAVAGDPPIGISFAALAHRLTNFRHPKHPPAAFTPDWQKQIQRMRQRIEKERTPAGKDELAIKTGPGGLMDAEFVAQALCLKMGWHEPNTLSALERARRENLLPEGSRLIENYRRLRRVEGILRRWSYEGETVLPDDPAPYYRVAIRCGFPNSQAFRDALRDWRRAIREVYLKVFPD